MTYKAFISYSHSADDKLAPAVQSALHRFAKPFYRLRAMRVFRDKTSLHLTPQLWPLIQQAIAQSEYFLLMASPGAAKSHWVQNEVVEWLRVKGSADKILLLLTDGEMVWDEAAKDFDWNRTDALPPNLRQVFEREPLYSDLRWARKATDLSLRNPQFLDEIGSLGATLHGKDKDEMIGTDVRQHRLFRAVTAMAVVVLVVITAIAIGAAFYAGKQRTLATSRELAASADSQLNQDPELSVMLSLQAYQRSPTLEAEEALRRSLVGSQVRATFKTLNWFKTAYSPDGKWFVLVTYRVQVIEPGTWRVIAELNGPTGSSVHGVSISRDGRHVLTVSQNYETKKSSVRLWDAGTWKNTAEFLVAEQDDLPGAALSPDGTLFATWSSTQKTPYLWNVITRQSVALGEPAFMEDVVFSPDGKTLITAGRVGGGDNPASARIWDTAIGRMRFDLQCRGASAGSMAYSPDGKFIALICDDATPRVIEAATGKKIAGLQTRSRFPHRVTFSPDGKYLVTTGDDQSARVWETGTWLPAGMLQGHTGELETMSFSGDGRVLVTSSHDGTARVWESGTWRSLGILRGHVSPMHDMAVSPNGRYVVTTATDSTARLWEMSATGTSGIIELHGASENGLADALPVPYSPEAKFVAIKSATGTVEMWEAATGRRAAELTPGSFLGFSPDGKFAFTTAFKPYVRGQSFDAEMWNTATWQKSAGLPGHSDVIRSIAFSADSRLAATAGGEVRIWELSSGKSIAVLHDEAWRVAFSPDGKWLAAVSSEPAVRIWNTGTWKLAAELHGHTAWVRAVAFSPDGTRLVTAGEDQTARLWETGKWRGLAVLKGHTDRVDEVAFSPDGKSIVTASGDRTARLWDGTTGRLIAVLAGHTGSVNSGGFSPDSRLIATSGDTTVRIWEGTNGRPLRVIPAVTRGLDSSNSARTVRAASFSPDGNTLLISASDNTTFIYAREMFAPVVDLLALARNRITRDFTRDEKAKYLH